MTSTRGVPKGKRTELIIVCGPELMERLSAYEGPIHRGGSGVTRMPEGLLETLDFVVKRVSLARRVAESTDGRRQDVAGDIRAAADILTAEADRIDATNKFKLG